MSIAVHAIAGVPEVAAGDDLGEVFAAALAAATCGPPADGDIVVVAQKAISKAEGMFVDLRTVTPSDEALRMAGEDGRDPRLAQVVLDETHSVLRRGHGVTICETHHGFVCANAGVDSSNVPGEDVVLLLPRDPDASARRLRSQLAERFSVRLGVVVTDSFGRAWRVGQADVAIGCAGLQPVHDARGQHDREGRELMATQQAVGDELAAAADLARGKASGEPLVLVRGCERFVTETDGPGASTLLRDRSEDLFR